MCYLSRKKPKTYAEAINGGCFVFNHSFFDHLSDDDQCVLEREPSEKLFRRMWQGHLICLSDMLVRHGLEKASGFVKQKIENKVRNVRQPFVSVITPTYNAGKFIGETIESVINQTYQNWEMLVIDDGSTDNTRLVVESYLSKDRRIKLFPLGYNSGRPAVPRNYGIKHAQGKYIAFLDSDDMWHYSKLEKQLQYFCDKEIVGVGTQAILIGDTPFDRRGYRGRSTKGYVDYDYYSILNINPIMTSSIIVRRDILSVVGGFDENPNFRFIEDWELWLRMAREGNFRVLREQLLSYRVFSEEDRDRIDVAKRKLKILKKQLDLGYIRRKDIREPRARVNLFIARTLVDSGDPVCRRYYLSAFKDSSILRRKLKACGGYFLSLQPRVFQRIILSTLDRIDRILSRLGLAD